MRVLVSITRCIGVTLLVAGTSCSQSKPEVEEVLRPVRAEQVFASGGGRVRAFSGVARAGTESKISFRVAGSIARLTADVGTTVQEGQLIAELDPEDYRLKVQSAEASLSLAKAQERNAAADYQRIRGLYENRNASRQDLDGARALHESAVANVESLVNSLALARRQLAYTKLKAPVAGAIAARYVEINENVSAGQVVCLLNSDTDLEVDVAIPGVLISRIAVGNPVSIAFDALPNVSLPGTVKEVGVAATGMATTFPVAIRLDDMHADVRSGMSAEVAFRFEPQGRDVIYVPAVAVGEDREGRFVFVVQPGGEDGVSTVKRTPVQIGDLYSDGLEILEGLADASYVVTAGVSRLSDGQKVRFKLRDNN